jgi:hypothetical protein
MQYNPGVPIPSSSALSSLRHPPEVQAHPDSVLVPSPPVYAYSDSAGHLEPPSPEAQELSYQP